MRLQLKEKINLMAISFLIIWVSFVSILSIFFVKGDIVKIKEVYSIKNIKSIVNILSVEMEDVTTSALNLENLYMKNKEIEYTDLFQNNVDGFYVFNNNNMVKQIIIPEEKENLSSVNPHEYIIESKLRVGLTSINGMPAVVNFNKHNSEQVTITIRLLNKQRLERIYSSKDNEVIFSFLKPENKSKLYELKEVTEKNIEKLYILYNHKDTKAIYDFIIKDYFQKDTIQIRYNFDRSVSPYIHKSQSEYIVLMVMISIVLTCVFIYILDTKLLIRIEKNKHESDVVCNNNSDDNVVQRKFRHSEKKLSDAINSLEAYKEQVDFYSKYDNLTALINTEVFIYEGDKCIKENNNKMFALIYINLDGFATFNSSFGYAKGDEILRKIAMRLNNCIDSKAILARIGGDEFGILVKNVENQEVVEEYIKDIISNINSIRIGGECVSASLGICLKDGKNTTTFEMLNNACLAMVSVKERGKNGYEFFEGYSKDQITIDMIENGIKNGEIELYYQPKVNFFTNEIDGVEVLARWFHPNLGYIQPVKIIKAAEDTGYISTLGKWILNKACSCAKELNEACNTKIRVSVNISPIQFMEKGFVNELKEIINRWQLNPRDLELEFTKDIENYNCAAVISKLEEINELGIGIIIDNFDAESSSFKYFQQYKVDTIKLDSSLVKELEKDNEIIKSIIELSHMLGLKVVAKGVENFAQAQRLIQLSCDCLQGYFFYKPMSFKNLRDIVEKYKAII